MKITDEMVAAASKELAPAFHYYAGTDASFDEAVRSALTAALAAAPAIDREEIEGRMAIRIEKLMCEKLGRAWTPDGISIVTLIDELYRAAPASAAEPVKPYDNDAVWARFYRDGKTLGEICEEFNVGIYSLSPWLAAPLARAAMQATDATNDT